MSTMFDNEDLIRSDGNFVKRVLCLKNTPEGSVLPDHYGIAWFRWDRMEAVIAPIPWNIVLRYARQAYFWLQRGGSRQSEQAAYERGITQGQAIVNRRRFYEREQLELDVKQEYAKGWSAGRMALHEELIAELDKGGIRGRTRQH